jgi:DNA polymerase III subunit delta
MAAPSVAAAGKFLAAPPPAVLGFLIFGTDDMQIAGRAAALVQLLRARAGQASETVKLQEPDIAADPGRITMELTSGSLFSDVKILWLTGLPAKAHSVLAGTIERPFKSAYLVVQAPDLKKSHKLVQAFESAPFLAAIPCYGEDRESLNATIKQHALAAGYEIDTEVAGLIAVRSDGSALLAISQIEKLMTFAGNTRRIVLEDANACLADHQTAGAWQIAEYALDGAARRALLAFQRFAAAEQNVSGVFAVLSLALIRLHALRTAADSGKPLAQAVKELRPPVFFKQQEALIAQAGRWTAACVLAQMDLLNQALKESRLRPALAEDIAEKLLIGIATATKAAPPR